MSNLSVLLRHSSDSEPGIRRNYNRDEAQYFHPDGRAVKCKTLLERIAILGLPPAYVDVWICPDDFGHIQATGRDEAGRKQYRYHDAWREFRDREKFNDLIAFGRALPSLRRKITRDLRRDEFDERKVCALVTRLLDRAALRIGSRANAKTRKIYGATTLRGKHIQFDEDGLHLDYTAKGAKRVQKTIRDQTLHETLEEISDLPGHRLFKYYGRDGELYNLDSRQVNAYLGEDFTAKTFRTWHGTLAAFKCALTSRGGLTIKAMSEAAAQRLHNTPAICRSSYIHPKVTALAELSDDKRAALISDLPDQKTRGLRRAERLCLNYLQA